MAASVRGVPEGASVVIPRLVCRDPAMEIDFIATTFGAEERVRRPDPDGSVAHALMTIGPAMVMIEAEWPTLASRAPALDGSSPVVLFVYVEDVDAAAGRAAAAGAQVLMPAQDHFWGDRTAQVMDPSGHVWTIATRIEETTVEERTRRWSGILAGGGGRRAGRPGRVRRRVSGTTAPATAASGSPRSAARSGGRTSRGRCSCAPPPSAGCPARAPGSPGAPSGAPARRRR